MRKLLLASAATIGATLAMSGGAKAQPVKPVAPGTLVVHVNGYIQFEFAAYGSTVNTVVVPKTSTVTTPGTYKLNPITTDGDVRIYPGFDAQTVTGLEYGAQAELRTATADANVGADKVSGAGSSAGTDGIYVKRAYGYIGAPASGFIRLGQTDSAFSLLQTGDIEAFGDGAQFNTDGGESSLLPTDATPGNFIYADASNLYATDKIVVLSPAVAGFSAAAGYEPNSNGIKEGYGNNAAASDTSAALSSAPVPGDIGKRRKNTIDAAVMYALTANGFATKVSAGVLYGAPIGYTGAAASLTAAPHGYDALEVYEIGAQTTFAGLTVGADVKGGQVEDSYYFKPKGARDALTFIIGASYVLGPYVLGASFYDGQSSGAYVPGSKTIGKTLTEYGAAAGGNYVISPHLSLFAQYEYGHKHQIGGTYAVSAVTGAYKIGRNNLQAQALAGGLTLKW
jgi:hypothetical protein